MLTLFSYLLLVQLTGKVVGVLMVLPFFTDLLVMGLIARWGTKGE